MTTISKTIVITLFAINLQQAVHAQITPTQVPSSTATPAANAADQGIVRDYKSNSLTLKVGAASPFTDISSFNFKVKSGELQPGFGLSFNHMFTSVFGLQLNAGYDMLKGVSDKDTVQSAEGQVYHKLGFPAPVYFKTGVTNASVTGYVNVANLAMSLKKANLKPNSERRFGMYVAAGVGIANFNSKIFDKATNKAYATYDTTLGIGGNLRGTSGSVTAFDIPMSIGIKYKINKNLDIGLDHTMHWLMSDKLDAYVYDLNQPSRHHDKYMLNALTLTYKFVGKNSNTDYIEWLNPVEVMYDDYQVMSQRMHKVTTDADNDGVSDYFDKEPNTPAGAIVDGSGKALDSDGDGVPDYKDIEPFTPKGATVDANGKAIDSDGDGVPDVLDKEPNTPAGSLVDVQGRTIRQDFATKEDLANVGFIAPTIYFDENSSKIKPTFYASIAEVAKYMKNNPNARITVTGNTDVKGSERVNERLGKRRADAVKTFLTKYYKIDASRIETASAGKKDQVYKKVYAINRRVEIEVQKSGNGGATSGTSNGVTDTSHVNK